ncbi:hypothetical protein SAMN05443634_10342 [Chishuiella changwenlii]|mgnify:CR=1 FL=1|uniref:Uncharacterized protein n=1 Tax=Chishuiella changwenlii TaxID=1434701 RepID=A0A1M6USH0_9FLAO|nr:hypothetical protein [Chishuiella changwenlii]GGF08097.1 hypothetical protein GCM10010984_26630 [Chishuiella changwenlii]SHK72177.1 hypothetical protein SAMN05443634_10342 [Chishuiella changwenlii]
MRRKIYLSIIIVVISFVNGLAQKISTTQFGDIKSKMNNVEVSKLNPKQLTVMDVSNEDMPEQDITINGITYHVVYYNNLKTKKLEVYSVSSTSKNLSTLSGIKVGSTLNDLWKNYKNYDISVKNNFDTRNNENSKRIFILNDIDNGSSLYFYLNKNTISEIKLVNESAYLNNNIYEN